MYWPFFQFEEESSSSAIYFKHYLLIQHLIDLKKLTYTEHTKAQLNLEFVKKAWLNRYNMQEK